MTKLLSNRKHPRGGDNHTSRETRIGAKRGYKDVGLRKVWLAHGRSQES